ncbi:Fc.00g114970.m01.CDS01 [Cosmosporella sp. VM-42]
MASPKSITIRGGSYAGKRTLAGYLLYNFYHKIPEIYEDNGLVMSFETESGPFIIEETNTPDIAVWLAPASQEDGRESSEELRALLLRDNHDRLQPKEKLLILINHMDFISWYKEYFDLIVESFIALDYGSTPTFIAPISALGGSNVLDSPSPPPWVRRLSAAHYPGNAMVTSQTLMQLLCGEEEVESDAGEKESPESREKSGCCVIF